MDIQPCILHPSMCVPYCVLSSYIIRQTAHFLPTLTQEVSPRKYPTVLSYVYIAFVWPGLTFSFQKAVVWITVPNILFSFCFMLNSQINHLTLECSNASDTNFLKHQVITAQNFGCDSLFCIIFSGGLNYQIEHHLFPFLNHCHLPALGELYRALDYYLCW